ncbi:MAG TPA: universal stress protein, partial [Burkholderiaceae bacterium]
ILVPFDGSTASAQGLDEAIKLAKLTGARLRIIYEMDEMTGVMGLESYAVYSADLLASLQQAGAAILQHAKAKAKAAGVEAETEMFQSVGPRLVERVIEQVSSWKADLIVIGSHGRRGMARLLLGSDAEQIVRLAPVPVLLVRQHAQAAAA